ncbi:Hsp20/alpha crystallin family protein [Elioraea sp.]|uniref:Hsp20/alpha crystallin family protein n=1 Tax=Elioraea sp. TaxID=2185103 RepID=UPI00262E2C46|nr:Hsp20/alpha crystallin family protein [Elioraea sp.]
MGEALDRNPFRTTASAFPPLNLWHNEAAVAVVAQVPGVAPEDIEITVKDDVLAIAGQRRPPDVPQGAVWHRRERSFGRFTRVVRLPFVVDPSQVEARFTNGVLTIALQRPEAQRPRRIAIKAG